METLIKQIFLRFVVTLKELDQVYNRGGGRVAFEFADDQQLLFMPWNCYSPHNEVTLDPNFNVRQDWHVEVNQRYTFSFGCLVNKK